MPTQWKVRLSGTGGQGVIMASILLAQAAVREGRNAVQSQSYGPEARGGASKAEVIISDQEIVYPKIDRPNVLVCLSQASCEKYLGHLSEEGILILDTSQIKEIPNTKGKVYKVPITDIARETGAIISANIVALGVLVGLTDMVAKESLIDTLQENFSKQAVDLNTKAFTQGISAGCKAKTEAG